MKRILTSTIAVIIALVSVVGGTVWAVTSGGDLEAIILIIVSALQIIGFIVTKASNGDESKSGTHLTVKAPEESLEEITVKSMNLSAPTLSTQTRAAIIEGMKTKLRILFIDDDKNFNVVKILKDSGWKHTKTLIDLKTLELAMVKEADVYFVDINGVGKQLNLEYEGLDLALMLKQKYPEKKVVIYSANKNSNSFHKAWDECDFKLEKNALPYQFQSLVEKFSIEIQNAS
jgi:hypothetical protein